MALRSSIFKANISLANLNTQIYDDIALTLALHPSETEERMMYRILAYLFCLQERLEFTEGLNNPDLPDIWQKDFTGAIEHWVDLGFPDEKRIKKALGRSNKVSIFTYNHFKFKIWFEKVSSNLINNPKVFVYCFEDNQPGELLQLVERSMILNCVIEDEQIFLSNNTVRAQINIKPAKK